MNMTDVNHIIPVLSSLSHYSAQFDISSDLLLGCIKAIKNHGGDVFLNLNGEPYVIISEKY